MSDLYKNAFPDFVLDVAIPDGFVDDSWKNDICPKWYNEDKNLLLFIEYQDIRYRETPDEPRFMLAQVDSDQEFDKGLIITDDYQEILNYLKGDL